MSTTIHSYAAAVLDVARAEGVSSRVEDELYQIARTVEGNPALREQLTAPGGDLATQLGIIGDLLGGRAHQQTIATVVYLVAAGRARELSQLADAVVARTASERQHEVAEVRSAVALDDTQVARLTRALSTALGKDVETKVTVDPDVVGGLVVKMGDTVIDGSVARRLADLKARLLGA